MDVVTEITPERILSRGEDPKVIGHLHENIAISDNTPRDVFEVARSGKGFDYVISVCGAASAERCPPVLGIAEQIQWKFKDPAAFEGPQEERLNKTRHVRDAIRARIDECAGLPAG